MVDDKDDSAPDPWAGIGNDGEGQADEGFTFSFDTTGDPDALESLKPDAAADDLGDVSAWLEEPDVVPMGEPPLAVFPSAEADATEPAPAFPEAHDDASAFGDFSAPDDLHASADQIPGAVGSSHVELGTGMSGVVSASEVDPTSDITAADDWADALAAETSNDDFSTDEQPSFDASGFDGASESGDAIPFGAPASDDAHADDMAVAGAAVAPAVAPAATRAARAQGGGLGQLIGIVLGGLMAIPITYAILLWGFQRDPFKLTGMLPQEVAFLLPQKFQPGGSKKMSGPTLDAASPLDNLSTAAAEPEAGETPVVPEPEPPLPDPREPDPAPAESAKPAAVTAATEPAPAPTEPAPESQPAPPLGDVAMKTPPVPVPVTPPEPEPLDVSDLDAAVGDATAAFEELSASDPESPDRRKLLVGWYKRLAAVAEQLVLLEKVAVDSGRSLDGTLDGVVALGAAVGADATMQAELEKLSGMWLASRRRPADGAVLLATFEGARKVGPYWSSRITVQGTEPRSVSVISRSEPVAETGETVMVTGVLFDGDVVWASDCRTIAKKVAPVEDLF